MKASDYFPPEQLPKHIEQFVSDICKTICKSQEDPNDITTTGRYQTCSDTKGIRTHSHLVCKRTLNNFILGNVLLHLTTARFLEV